MKPSLPSTSRRAFAATDVVSALAVTLARSQGTPADPALVVKRELAQRERLVKAAGMERE